jgi:hypothetical protein
MAQLKTMCILPSCGTLRVVVWLSLIAFGVNATIRDGVHIAEGTLFAMGTNFTGKKTEPWSIYKGNPAEKQKFLVKTLIYNSYHENSCNAMSNYEQKFICPKTKTALVLAEDGNTLHNTSTEEPISYEINDIVDLTYPKELFEQDRKEQLAYNDAYQRYDRGVTWVFESLNSDEATVRQKMTNLLGLKPE